MAKINRRIRPAEECDDFSMLGSERIFVELVSSGKSTTRNEMPLLAQVSRSEKCIWVQSSRVGLATQFRRILMEDWLRPILVIRH